MCPVATRVRMLVARKYRAAGAGPDRALAEACNKVGSLRFQSGMRSGDTVCNRCQGVTSQRTSQMLALKKRANGRLVPATPCQSRTAYRLHCRNMGSSEDTRFTIAFDLGSGLVQDISRPCSVSYRYSRSLKQARSQGQVSASQRLMYRASQRSRSCEHHSLFVSSINITPKCVSQQRQLPIRVA